MPRGRPPTPTKLNNLKGDPSTKRRNTKEPTPPTGTPVCPKHLDKVAKEEWKSVCEQLDKMQLLSTADKTALEMYCVNYSRWRKAKDHVTKHGDVIIVGKNDYPMISPHASIMNQTFEQCRKLLIEFGCTPSARARMRVSADDKGTDNKWAGVLKVAT